jgi:hypothetical protein
MSRPPDIGADDPMVVAIAALTREELSREAAAGFPTLTRIPSSGVIKSLDYLATLSDVERAALLDVQARLAALQFFPSPLIANAYEQLRTTDPACLRRQEVLRSRPFADGLRYAGLRMARAMVTDPETVRHMAQTRATLDFTPRDDLPEQLVGATDIRDIQTAKAPLLRKLLNEMLRNRLGARPNKRPGGELVYEGRIGPIPLEVSITFSNLYAQMVYRVHWSMRERNLIAQRLTYETLWGTNTGWDYLTEENAARSIDLLDQLLVSIAGLIERIARLPTPG